MSAHHSLMVNDGETSSVAPSRYLLPSLHHVLDILEFLHAAGEPASLSALASHVGLTKPGVHRILRNLISRGYVLQEGRRGAYFLGTRLWELGTLPSVVESYRAAITPFLHRLTAEVGEASHLVIMEGHDIVYLSRVVTSQAVQAYGRVGDRAPAHCVATGKAILASTSDSYLDVFLENDLVSHTAKTITNKTAFRDALNEVRETGFAINDSEWRDGVTGVGVALHPRRQWLTAIGVFGPAYRFDVELAKEVAGVLSRVAVDIDNISKAPVAVNG